MSTKAREFFICDETDNSGYSVREWSEKEANRQFGACNVFHVIEYSAYEELIRQNEIMAEAIKDFLDCSGGIDPNDERLGWLREALAKCGKITNKD